MVVPYKTTHTSIRTSSLGSKSGCVRGLPLQSNFCKWDHLLASASSMLNRQSNPRRNKDVLENETGKARNRDGTSGVVHVCRVAH